MDLTALGIDHRKYDVGVDFDQEMDATIKELNDRNVCLMDYPAEVRHETFIIEKELTKAANEGDSELFMALLTKYKNSFH